jgi:hypothetical protein
MNLEPIDTSTTAGKIRVMELALQGRKVVYGYGDTFPWSECVDPEWDWSIWNYAIIRADLAGEGK